jgi:hypothetical protein
MFSAISMQVHKLVTKMRFQGKEKTEKINRQSQCRIILKFETYQQKFLKFLNKEIFEHVKSDINVQVVGCGKSESLDSARVVPL